MLDQKEVKKRFERETKDHTMEVLMDNGVYRHLKFTKGGSQVYRFDIHTWPGYLCICQDMGTYVFSRIHDMFEFFIMDDNDLNKKHVINPHYWAEKLQAVDGNRNSGYKQFSQEVFEENVKQEYDNFAEQYKSKIEDERDAIQDDLLRDEVESVENVIAKYEVNKNKPALTETEQMLEELWETIEYDVIGASSDGDVRAYDAAIQFNWGSDDGKTEFDMADFWDYDCTDYNYHYIWILYAIVWGIIEYNKSKGVKAA